MTPKHRHPLLTYRIGKKCQQQFVHQTKNFIYYIKTEEYWINYIQLYKDIAVSFLFLFCLCISIQLCLFVRLKESSQIVRPCDTHNINISMHSSRHDFCNSLPSTHHSLKLIDQPKRIHLCSAPKSRHFKYLQNRKKVHAN